MIERLRHMFRRKATTEEIQIVVNETNNLLELYGIDKVTWALETIADVEGRRSIAIATLARIPDGQERRRHLTEFVKTLGYITEAKENYYHNSLGWQERYDHWVESGRVQ